MYYLPLDSLPSSSCKMESPPDNHLKSPKRKRGALDPSVGVAPCASRLRTTDLPTRPNFHPEDIAGNSPRAMVAGRLQDLHLAEKPDLSGLNCDKSSKAQVDWARGSGDAATSDSQSVLPLLNDRFPNPITPPTSSCGPQYLPLWPAWSETRTQCLSSAPPLEIPETPHLRPTSTPTPPLWESKLKAPPPSPNPALWWSDTEITGHNPDPGDPMDDGEGINGVGFLPTPAMATARAEKRRRQVKEWKEREGREARARRGEGRRRREMEGGNGVATGLKKAEARESDGRRVRFVEV